MKKNLHIEFKGKKIKFETEQNTKGNNEVQENQSPYTIAKQYIKRIIKEFNLYAKNASYCNDDFKEFLKALKAEAEYKEKN